MLCHVCVQKDNATFLAKPVLQLGLGNTYCIPRDVVRIEKLGEFDDYEKFFTTSCGPSTYESHCQTILDISPKKDTKDGF
jgi:hypothetical protein